MPNNFVKVINATYTILDFLPDADPLKHKAKEKALAVLESLALVSDANGWASLKKETAAWQLLDDLAILETYLVLAKQQGWIDTMNFLIITKEYQKIKESINPFARTIHQNLTIASKRDIAYKKEIILQERVGRTEPYSVRQKKILKMLGDRERIQVADIVKELSNVTKRTVRRDLDDLLKKGKIMRSGEFSQVFYKLFV